MNNKVFFHTSSKLCNTHQTKSKGKHLGSYHLGCVENYGRERLGAIGKCCEQFIGLINGLFLHMLWQVGSEHMSKISLILHVPMSCLRQLFHPFMIPTTGVSEM